MAASPEDFAPWVVRTDLSDDTVWSLVQELVAAPQVDSNMEFTANVRFVEIDLSDSAVSHHDLIRSLPDDYPGFFVFVVDAESISGEEHSIVVVDFSPQEDDVERTPSQVPLEDIRAFRAIPSCIQAIENNLSIGNMDFDDFANSLDQDGVFRGFQ